MHGLIQSHETVPLKSSNHFLLLELSDSIRKGRNSSIEIYKKNGRGLPVPGTARTAACTGLHVPGAAGAALYGDLAEGGVLPEPGGAVHAGQGQLRLPEAGQGPQLMETGNQQLLHVSYLK